MSRCTATTKKGTPCPIQAGPSGLCHVHDPNGRFAGQHPGYAAKLAVRSQAVPSAGGAPPRPRATRPPAQARGAFDLADPGRIPPGFQAVAYTDGACSPNPGPGGWGLVLATAAGLADHSGAHPATTNQEMELTAALAALERLGAGVPVLLVTDSQWVINGITSWVGGWARRGWTTASGQPVKHQGLWRRLAAANHADVTWHWVKGHAGVPGNERADRLAVAARERLA